MWEFQEYTVYEETDVLRFEDIKGNILGYVSYSDSSKPEIKALNEGANPIQDKWEDGVGNELSLGGWEV